MNVTEEVRLAPVDVSMAFWKSTKSVEEASAAVVSINGQDEVIWIVFRS